MTGSYFTLVVRENDLWQPQFGDLDRETVEAEADDYFDHGTGRKDMKIVRTKSVRQEDLNAAVAKLNARAAPASEALTHGRVVRPSTAFGVRDTGRSG